MMTDERPSTPPQEDMTRQKSKAGYSIIIVMVILGTVFVGFLAYQYLETTGTDVPVLKVEVEVIEVGNDVHITSIKTVQSSMDLLDSPREDSSSIFPGVRVKLSKGQNVISYDAFVSYKGPDIYNLIVGFSEKPKEDDMITCAVWVFKHSQGSFPDDQETTQVFWAPKEATGVLRATVDIHNYYKSAGNTTIENVNISQVDNQQGIANAPSKFPGVYAYVLEQGTFGSYIACEGFEEIGRYGLYLYIGLFEEPVVGEDLTIVVVIWPRDGEWVTGYYPDPADSYIVTYTWS
jgi:hypothetical protein